MIPRYSRPEMTAIWDPENKFRIWLEIEAHACDAQAELGVIPKEAAQAVWEHGAFDVDRIDEIERETKHDVIAFLTNLAEHVGEDARFVHQGMTSSDVLVAFENTWSGWALLPGRIRIDPGRHFQGVLREFAATMGLLLEDLLFSYELL